MAIPQNQVKVPVKVNNETKNLKIYYKPYDKQSEIHNSKAKYRMVCLGRRSGKTYLAAAEIIKRFQTTKRPLKIGWLAPTYNVVKRGLDTFKVMNRELIAAKLIKVCNSAPFTAQMGDHMCYFLSTENPTAILGYYFDLIIIDEAAYIPDEVFNETILPLLLDTDGDMIAISTPKGKKGWFSQYFQLAKISDDIDSFNWSTYDNPFINNSVIDSLKLTMPILSFHQEILAEFIDAEDQVFQEVKQCFSMIPCKCKCGSVVGIDLARKQDDTVMLSLCPKCKTIRAMNIHKEMPWSQQLAKIPAFHKLQNANITLIDGTGLGDVVQDLLQKEDIRYEPIIFSAPTKYGMYTDLIYHIEQGLIKWDPEKFPEVTKQLLELEREVKKTTTSYNACTGGKDDICDALVMALKGCLDYKELHIYSLTQEKAEQNNKPGALPERSEENESWWD